MTESTFYNYSNCAAVFSEPKNLFLLTKSMNFILENGVVSKLVAVLIGICVLSLVVVFVWFKKRKELREKEKRQQAIRLRHELAKNKL